MISKKQIADIYQLTPMQKGMLFHNLREPNSYICQSSYSIKGNLDIGAVENSINELIARHSILRTSFIYEIGKEPLQVVLKERKVDINFKDLTKTINNQEDEINKHKEDYKNQGFDLSRDNLLRLTILQTSSQEFVLIWTFHHILMDGWCVSTLINEFYRLYFAYVNDEEIALSPSMPYKNYIQWLKKRNKEESKLFWKSYLEGYEQKVDIPSTIVIESNRTHEGNLVYKEFSFDSNTTNKIKELSIQLKVTVNTVLQAVWGIMLNKYNDSNDIIFGSVMSGRPSELEGIDTAIGLFINTVPVRVKYASEANFSQLVTSLWEDSRKITDYQYESLAKLQNQTILKQDLINTLYIFENYPDIDYLEIEQRHQDSEENGFLEVEKHKINEYNSYELTLICILDQTLSLRLEYDQNLYNDEIIESFFIHFKNVIDQVLESPNVPIDDLQLMSKEERTNILELSAGGFKEWLPEYSTIQDSFQIMASKFPEKIALIYEDSEITYEDLNIQANKLAGFIRSEYKINPGDRIGLILQKSDQMIMTILAVLKSGGTYVPIDINTPKLRKQEIIKDAGIKLLITESHFMFDAFDFYQGPLFAIDVQNESYKDQSQGNPINISTSNDLAYIIYTSGSTGIPKGVAIEHRSICNTLLWRKDFYQLDEKVVNLQLPSYVFDSSVEDIFSILISGGTLVIPKEELKIDPSYLEQVIKEKSVSHILVTPSLYHRFLEELPTAISTLKVVTVAGEACDKNLIYQHYKLAPDVQLYNEYGPTENSVCTTAGKLEPHDETHIGKPIDNVNMYVLNDKLELLSIGVRGELYISGDGLARGYWNRKALTEEKFVPNPFNPKQKLYKTGDLGKLKSNGDFIYIGRKDNQIKLRGFRIEVNEIELALNKQEGINTAVVLLKRDEIGGDKLVAYYKSDITLNHNQLKSELSNNLPNYMVPSSFILVKEFPLTINGKLDHKSLLKLTNTGGKENKKPINDTEATLIEIWKEVLQNDSIGTENDFFECGGDSLLAIKLIVRINKIFNTTFKISFVFENANVVKMACLIDNSESSTKKLPDLTPIPNEEYYEISHSQQRLWLLNEINSTKQAYNITANYKIEGNIDINCFQKAWKTLIKRHESLRTIFILVEGKPYQKIIDYNKEFDVNIIDPAFDNVSLEEALHGNSNYIFNLNTGPLVRCLLICADKESMVLSMAFHHIVFDGWSMNIILNELVKLYEGFVNNKSKVLPELKIQYKDYSAWINKLLSGENFVSLKEYWLQKFSGTLPVLNIITDKPRPKMKSFNGDIFRFDLNRDTLNKIDEVKNETKSSLFICLTAFVKLLLYKYTNQVDIILGSPVAGRNHELLENQVGFYINTLPLRTLFDENQDFNELLSQVKNTVLEAFDHQAYPFDQLVSDLKLERDVSRSPLFDVMIVLQSQNKLNEFQENIQTSFKVEEYGSKSKLSHFDLTFQFIESENGISCSIIYNTDLFSQIRIKRMAEHFVRITNFTLLQPATSLKDIPYLSNEEYKELVETFNDTEHSFPIDGSIVTLFQKQVQKSTQETAVVYKNKSWNYGEIDSLSSNLAFYIKNKFGIEPGDRVGLLLNKSENIIISILAILKVRGTYVPIDPEFPQSRIDFIADDASLSLLITDELNSVKAEKLKTPIFISDRKEVIGQEETHTNELLTQVKPSDIAYVIYTSGSTGTPKGVLVSHLSVVNRINWMWRELDFDQEDAILQKTPYVFDVSVWELFLPICYGAKMVVCDKEVIYDPERLLNQIEKDKISTIHFVPTMFNFFINAINNSNAYKIKSLNRVITSGESLSRVTVNAFKNICDTPLFNLYGPTEATVDVTSFRTQSGLESIPIGKPIDNCQIYILDKYLKPIAKKVIGEIYIGGVGVAKGYLNRDELTATKFIPNPFNAEHRLYKTGDVGFWDESGNIEFVGRIDDQVKVKGFRIELGEVENALKNCKGVKEAIVVSVDNVEGVKELEAFLLSDDVLAYEEILMEICEILSEYMIPTRMYQIDKIPYTATGKVDKKELKNLKRKPLNRNNYTQLDTVITTNKEEVFLLIIRKVLGLENVTLADNFFHLGGDSIKAIIIANKLSVKGYKLLIQDVFNFPVLGSMASKITAELLENNYGIVEGEIPFTPIQSEIMLRNTIDSNHYNQSMVLSLKEEFKTEALIPIFEKITEHHDALRIIFKEEDGNIIQYNQDINGSFGYTEIDLTQSQDLLNDLNNKCESIQKSISLQKGPLFKVTLIKTQKGKLLFMVSHHLVTDGVSWRIILEDLELLHSQFVGGEDFILPSKTSSFKNWAKRLLNYGNEEQFLLKEKDYWKGIVSQKIEPISTDFAFAYNYLGDRLVEEISLDKEETILLLNEMNSILNVEINDVLVYSLVSAVKDTFGNNKIAVTMEGHGREEILENVNVNRTVGWFTSAYPVIFELLRNNEIQIELESTKKILREVPNKGVGFGILKFLTKDEHKTDIAYNLKSQISFNYLGQVDADIKSDIFKFENLPVGNNMSPKIQSVFNLDVSGAVMDKKLFMAISYSKRQYKDDTVKLLCKNYLFRLKLLINLIKEKKQSYSQNISTVN